MRKIQTAYQIYQSQGKLSLLKSTTRWILRKMVPRIFRIKAEEMRKSIHPKYVDDPYEVIWVDPSDIKYLLCESEFTDRFTKFEHNSVPFWHRPDEDGFDRRKNVGLILGGDWDKNKKPYERNIVYKSLVDRFCNETSWEETDLYQICVERLKMGYSSYGCDTEEEFKNDRLDQIEQLYESINNNGYLPKSQLSEQKRRHHLSPNEKAVLDEVCVNIGRSGEFIFNNTGGQHRLAIAKILDIEKIPVIPIVRHCGWESVRDEIQTAESYESLPQAVREQLNHPDLKEAIPESWPIH